MSSDTVKARQGAIDTRPCSPGGINGGTVSSTCGFSDGARLCERPRDRAFADIAGFDQDTRRSVFHQTLLRYIGCNADTHLLAEARGDEITLRRELHHIDIGNRAEQNLL